MPFDDVTVVVLAGGKGSRLKGLHPETPKPMIPVAGKPFLHWLTLWLASHGPQHFVYSTGYRGEQIEAWAAGGDLPGSERICCREAEPLGTGGGLFNCLDHCRQWVLVANGDGLVMKGVSELLAMRDRPGRDGGLLGVPVDDASRYGSLVVDAESRLTGFREKVAGRGMINGGLYLFRTAMLRAMRRPGMLSLEYDLFPEMIEKGAALGVVQLDAAPFIDIGTPETLAQAEAFVRQHLMQPSSP